MEVFADIHRVLFYFSNLIPLRNDPCCEKGIESTRLISKRSLKPDHIGMVSSVPIILQQTLPYRIDRLQYIVVEA
jgi:hypothetical protein